jgi:C-terminal processing protease CtpA/Prc
MFEKAIARFAVLTLACCLGFNAQSAPLTPAQAQADFDVLRAALEEAHGALYRFATKAEMDRRFNALRATLDHSMNTRELIGTLSEMVAGIGDGHSRLEYDEATTAALAAARLFPFRLLIEDTRLMVLSNDTPDDATIRPGMEILRINGRSARELLDEILPKLSGDGFIESGKKVRLGRTFGSSYWLFVDQAEVFEVTARDADGKTVRTKVHGVTTANRAKNENPVNERMNAAIARLSGPKDNISLRFVDEPNVAVLRIRGFEEEGFPAALEEAFRTLAAKGVKALILDLRGNAGGVDEWGALLVSHLANEPFRYFDRIRVATVAPSFSTWKPGTSEKLRNGVVPDPNGGFLVTPNLHTGVAEQKPSPLCFSGPLFVLLDGGTFSTAADVTAVLRHRKRASFIGDESGGTYEGNTSGLNALITLPHSRLRLKVQMYGYANAVTGGRKGRGTLPDHAVAKTTADLLRGIDAPLERATALARASVK